MCYVKDSIIRSSELKKNDLNCERVSISCLCGLCGTPVSVLSGLHLWILFAQLNVNYVSVGFRTLTFICMLNYYF